MTRLPIVLALAALLVPTTAHALLDGRGVDGITARIESAGPQGNDLVFTRDADGTIPVAVTVYREGAAGWAQTSMRVTLRAFVPQLDLTESDRASINFRASATAPTLVRIPAAALATGEPVDLFVTFSDLGGNPVPTSHHSVQKNALLAQGEYGLAETFDFHHVIDAVVG